MKCVCVATVQQIIHHRGGKIGWLVTVSIIIVQPLELCGFFKEMGEIPASCFSAGGTVNSSLLISFYTVWESYYSIAQRNV